MAKEIEKSGKSLNGLICTTTRKVRTKNEDLNDAYPGKQRKVKCLSEQYKRIPPNIEDNKISKSDCTTLKKTSKRQIKRKRVELREAILKDKSRSEATEKALSYISKWKYDRTNWKFEKLRQIWLIEHLLEDKLVPDAIFPVVLEYFDGCKGMAREKLIKKGMCVIKNAEDEENGDNLMMSTAYIRARQLIQILPMKV